MISKKNHIKTTEISISLLQNLQKFNKVLWNFYKSNKRNFAWRETTDPYKILVSEIMLQQTQVSRVLYKYEEFLQAFPNVKALANSPLSNVLSVWKGLGYNRRAKFIKNCAEKIMNEYSGVFPITRNELMNLPGIGQSTAGAIMAFSYNVPVVFIETNIRTVLIHHFFNNTERTNKKVTEKEIISILEQLLTLKNNKLRAREFYYALYDYGTHLKQTVGNKSKKSILYKKQSKFEGSFRQLRAIILHFIVQNKTGKGVLLKHINDEIIENNMKRTNEEIQKAVNALLKEEVVQIRNKRYFIKD